MSSIGLAGARQTSHGWHLASSRLPRCLPRRSMLFRSTTPTTDSPTIHVLGLGGIGTFAAHALAEIPERPATTLLLHRPILLDEYIQSGKKLILFNRKGQTTHTGYNLEVFQNSIWHTVNQDPNTQGIAASQQHTLSPTYDTISDLILCVKSTQTVAALKPLRPRLSRSSNILFLQNGAGMIEDANTHLWPDPTTRPNYITGVISHGVELNRAFDVTHTGPAATAIGPVPREDNTSLSSSHMLDALPLAPRLTCKTYDWPTILCIQLEKLACNAFSNPLCALADAPTSYLFSIET